jgi:hypothetical protein
MLCSRQDRRRILACCIGRHQLPDADVPLGVARANDRLFSVCLMTKCVFAALSVSDRPKHVSRDARPKRCDRLLDHESLVRQVRHNPLDDHECGEAKDRVPPSVGYHYVIPTWQSFILGNIKKSCTKRPNNGAPMSLIYCPARMPLRFSGPKKTLRNSLSLG